MLRLPPFSFRLPHTLADAAKTIAGEGKAARLVAGGTDLILDLEFGNHVPVEALVDVTAIPDLDRIVENDGWIELGAAATHAQRESPAGGITSCSPSPSAASRMAIRATPISGLRSGAVRVADGEPPLRRAPGA